MAAAVLSSSKLTNVHLPDRFHMGTSLGADASTSRAGAASSSRLQPSASQLQPQAPGESRPRTFSRLRTSLEQTLRTTGKSRGRQSVDETGRITAPSPSKGKEKASADETFATKERSKSSMLSKVSFRRPGGKEPNNASSTAQASVAGSRVDAARVNRDRDKGKVREAGYTSFETPSLRQASMSSPALHLSSQPFASPYSQPFALPAASSSNVAALVSPPRVRRSNAQATITTKVISNPVPLAPRKDPRANGIPQPAVEQKPSKHRPPPVSIQTANAGPSKERTSLDSLAPVETPTRRTRGGARSPDLSPPSPSPRTGHLAATASRRAAASATHLPLTSPPPLLPPRRPRNNENSSATPLRF